MFWSRHCLLLVFAIALAKSSSAAVLPQALSHAVPPGLNAGDRFHLLFVTRDLRNADSADISEFNDFVSIVADSAGIGPTTAGIRWFAVASTPTINARDNAFVQAPVYNMQGETLATGFDDMWDGTLSSAVNYDEYSTAIIPRHHVWTGSRSDGTGKAGQELGQIAAIVIGDLKLSDGRWLDASASHILVDWHLYALSEPLTMVPEPSMLVTIGGAIAGVIAVWRSRRLY